ncbi:MAG: hypothetical protein NZL88_11730, partial [Gaiellaceae bacterium]|nr:hypothetical protein [Gaiellaceae bacterium]
MTSAFGRRAGSPLAGVEVLDRERLERPRVQAQRLPDRLGATADAAGEVSEAAVLEQVVELFQRGDARHRHQVRAAEAPHLALDAALLV